MAMGCVAASAQEAKTVEVFKPHWYGQLQVGGQYTLGEVSFGHLISPNAQIGVGYNFNKVVGARLTANAWQSKAGSKLDGHNVTWKWNYATPMVDATFNLTNLFCKYNPKRLVNVGVFAGVGANIAWNNKDAANANSILTASKQAGLDKINTDLGLTGSEQLQAEEALPYLWKNKPEATGTQVLFAARVGANVDFRLSDRVSLGLEVSSNVLSDKYNSKRAGNPDWYFNGLVGIKYNFGKTHTTKKVEAPKPVERIIERIVEKPVPAPAKKEEVKQTLVKEEVFRRDIFFPIANSKIATSESSKINDIVNYMKENPDAKITVTGYADKGTGNVDINTKIAAQRAQTVYNTLVNKGISKSRIVKESKGSSEQPYKENDKNRVTICIAK